MLMLAGATARPLLRAAVAARAGTRSLAIATGAAPAQTALHAVHEEHGGKFIDFHGWSLPVQYKGAGVMKEHNHVRSAAGLFDVSHMGQVRITGEDRISFMESLVVGDVAGMAPNTGGLSLFTNEQGGIIDDTIINNRGDHLYVVINAACTEKDMAHMQGALAAAKAAGPVDCDIELLPQRSLLALQGPAAAGVIAKHLETPTHDLAAQKFMQSAEVVVAGAPVLLTRCGYTGEDGFEISVADEDAPALARALLAEDDVAWAGLGARDSLRLEAGLCLYGNDIDATTTPVEAGLVWTIGKNRRQRADFPGAEPILAQLANKQATVTRKRVGLLVHGSPARAGAPICDAEGNAVGVVTSGGYSPVLKKPIAMGYVPKGMHRSGTEVAVEVRGKQHPATVTKMPLVPTNYYM